MVGEKGLFGFKSVVQKPEIVFFVERIAAQIPQIVPDIGHSSACMGENHFLKEDLRLYLAGTPGGGNRCFIGGPWHGHAQLIA